MPLISSVFVPRQKIRLACVLKNDSLCDAIDSACPHFRGHKFCRQFFLSVRSFSPLSFVFSLTLLSRAHSLPAFNVAATSEAFPIPTRNFRLPLSQIRGSPICSISAANNASEFEIYLFPTRLNCVKHDDLDFIFVRYILQGAGEA